MLEEITAITPEQAKAVIVAPAVLANFVMVSFGDGILRLALLEKDSANNVVLRGAYALSKNDALSLAGLITMACQEQPTEGRRHDA